jgi:Spy/CpxP family protein refolding chaperone
MRATPLSRWVNLLVLGAFAGLLAAPALVLAQGSEPTTSKTTTATSSTKHKTMSNEEFDEHVNKVAEKLKLSDDQKEKFKTIMSGQRDKMKDMRAKYKGKTMTADDKAEMKKDMEALQADTDSQLSTVLTPDQMTEYKKMRSEKMNQAKHKMESTKKS